jgi:1-acyl-sn-glycerol-3-phosphate acyltransferase
MGCSLLSTGWTLAMVKGRPLARAEMQSWATRILSHLRVRVTLAAPIPAGGQLWVSNHLSWVDALVYLSLRPSRVMAKAEVAEYPGIGAGGRRVGLRFVKRESLASRTSALRALRRDLIAGDDFLVFPEGTTTHGDHLAPLYEGSLRMAYRMGVKVLPLRLDSGDLHYPWVGDTALMTNLKALAWNRDTRVSILPGRVLDPLHFSDEDSWLRDLKKHLETPGSRKDLREH